MVEIGAIPLSTLVAVALIAPLVGGAGSLAMRGGSTGRCGWPALLGLIVCLVVSGLLCLRLFRGEWFDGEIYQWIAVGDWEIAIGLSIVPFGGALLIGMALTGLAVQSAMLAEGKRGSLAALVNLNLVAAFLVVLGDGFPTLCIGWGALSIGLHLLPEATRDEGDGGEDGARWAWMVERIGDVALLAGIALIWARTGRLDYGAVEIACAEGLSGGIGLFLLVAVLVKIGLIPFHFGRGISRLAAVNALMRAVTAGTVGFYLVYRCRSLFSVGELAGQLLIGLAGASLLTGAAMALACRDIDRLPVHSTTSQFGLVFAGLALGAPVGATFLLLVHMLAKVLVFLGMGQAMLGAEGEFGERAKGLRRRLPVAFWISSLGYLALAGCPPLAGSWSHIALLNQVYAATGYPWLWLAGCASIALTAVYAMRALLAFAGEPDGEMAGEREDPAFAVPLVLLSLPVCLGGLLAYPPGKGLIDRFLGSDGQMAEGIISPLLLIVGPCGASLIGLLAGWLLYNGSAPTAKGERGPAGVLENELYAVELARRLCVRPLLALCRFLHDVVDTLVIELACVGGMGLSLRGIGWLCARLQTGRPTAVLIGAVVGAIAFLFALTRLH